MHRSQASWAARRDETTAVDVQRADERNATECCGEQRVYVWVGGVPSLGGGNPDAIVWHVRGVSAERTSR